MIFEVGDRVVLISGGPLMTVVEDSSGPVVKCTWFDVSQIRHTDEFVAATLRNLDPKTKDK